MAPLRIPLGSVISNLVRRGSVALPLILMLVSPVAALQPAGDDPRPVPEQPYLGLSVREYPEQKKCIVSWIYPGPLEGTGFNSPHLQRGDFLLAIDEVDLHKPDDLTALLRRYSPGDRVTLRIQRTGGDQSASVPTPGSGEAVAEASIVLASRAQWAGPVAWKRPVDQRATPEVTLPLAPGSTRLEAFLYEQLEQQGIREPIDKLREYFVKTLDGSYGANMLDRVAYGFQRPTRLAELQVFITEPLGTIPADPRNVLTQAARNLDVTSTVRSEAIDLSDPDAALRAVDALFADARGHLDRAFAELDDETRQMVRTTLPELVDFVADNFYINTHPEVGRLIRTLNVSMEIDFGALIDSAGSLSGLMLVPTALPVAQPEAAAQQGDGAGADQRDGAPARSSVPIPDELADAVRGDVLAILEASGRLYVYGGFGPNEYDMSLIDCVIDAGGDDTYRYPDEATEANPSIQVIVDLAGNDKYLGGDSAIAAGPAGALLGVSLLVDHAGNDRYEGKSRSCGAGMMGVGLLVDRAGADTYTGTKWSVGAAFYGVGAVIDLGSGNDVYTTHHFSQAIGGPRGFGLILDQNGRDLYRNNGPIESVYGTDAVYSGISQGVGFGVRGYDTGGIGVLCDLGGADRYEAGEFSQGGAYYWGLGILYDKAGRDLYYGNRYTQGFAAHQALGILADDAGDDTYWGMTAATQSGSWDICATLLIDRAGNDTYQADGLAQGGASMQAIAWLIDLEGTDRYNAPNGATHGQSGGNSYHYDATGCFSWSLLLDAGGTEDFYSTGRPNGATISTGKLNEERPENSSLHGLFIDTPEKMTFW